MIRLNPLGGFGPLQSSQNQKLLKTVVFLRIGDQNDPGIRTTRLAPTV